MSSLSATPTGGRSVRGEVWSLRVHILKWNGRRVEISVECDARQPFAAVAKPLSSVADGDLLGAEGGYGAGARFLESFLEGKETIVEVSSMDAGDERVLRFRKDILA